MTELTHEQLSPEKLGRSLLKVIKAGNDLAKAKRLIAAKADLKQTDHWANDALDITVRRGHGEPPLILISNSKLVYKNPLLFFDVSE